MTILYNKKWGGGITPLKKGGKHWFSLVSYKTSERGSEAV